MPYYTIRDFNCDYPREVNYDTSKTFGCIGNDSLVNYTKADAWKILSKSGWTKDGDKYYCRVCSKKKKEA